MRWLKVFVIFGPIYSSNDQDWICEQAYIVFLIPASNRSRTYLFEFWSNKTVLDLPEYEKYIEN